MPALVSRSSGPGHDGDRASSRPRRQPVRRQRRARGVPRDRAVFTFGFELLARGAFAGAGDLARYGGEHGRRGDHPPAPVHRSSPSAFQSIGLFGLCLAIPPALATLVALRGTENLMTPPGLNALRSERASPLEPWLAAPAFAPRAGAELRAVPGLSCWRDPGERGRCGRRLHRRPVPLPHPDPAVPGGPRRCRAAPGSGGAGERGTQRRVPPRDAQPPARGHRHRGPRRSSVKAFPARSSASCCSARSSSSATSTSPCWPRGAGCSSWPSPCRRG